MNSKEFKAEKKLKKKNSNLKNGGQQVFVLPPNLLQKLGINLGNMGSTHIPDMGRKMSTCVTNHKNGHSSNKEHEINTDNISSETSITTTASLMKESVFLSPTFNTASLNIDTSSHIDGYVDVCNSEINYVSEKNNTNLDDKVNLINVVSEYDLLKNKNLPDRYNRNAGDVGLPIENTIPKINGSTTPAEKSVVQNETKKVINILSQETVTVAKLNEFKVLQMPAKNKMIPATLNTIIVKNAKKTSTTQSHTAVTFTEGITDNTNLQCSESCGKFINDKIIMPETESILKMDTNIYQNTEHFCNSDKNESNRENHTKAFNSKKPDLSGSFDNENGTEILSNTEYKKKLDDPILQRNVGFNPTQNNFEVFDKVINKETISSCQDYIEEVQSPATNNYYQELPIYENNPLLHNHSNIVKQVDEPVKIVDNTRNIKSNLPDTTKLNNNSWDHNKSSLEQNEVLMHIETTYVDSDQQKSFQTNSSSTDEENSSHIEGEKTDSIDTTKEINNIFNNLEKCTPHTLNTDDDQHTSLKSINDNCKSMAKNVISVKKQSISDIIDDEGIGKLSLSLNPKRNNLMSKLCIQGVEKPGGINIDTPKPVSIRTYSNIKKYKKKHFSHEKTIRGINSEYNHNIDSNESRTINLLPSQQFCKCRDYGILDFSQFDNSYEHIHFTCRKSLICNPHVIYGIYDDKMSGIAETIENVARLDDNIDQVDLDNPEPFICWFNAGLQQNELDTGIKNSHEKEVFYESTDTSELNVKDSGSLMNIDQNNSINSNVRNQIEVFDSKYHLEVKPYVGFGARTEVDRKTYSKTNSNKLDFQNLSGKRQLLNNCNEGSSNKRVKSFHNHEISKQKEIQQTDESAKHGFIKGWQANDNIVKEEFSKVLNKQKHVKCGVCSVNVVNTEWLTHIASTHDYIAWKDGDTSVNLEDEDEIRDHLHQIVQDLGQLQCSNCGMIRKYAKSFLHHIKTCYNSSDTSEGRSIPYHLSKILDVVTVFKCDRCGYKTKNAKDYETHTKKCNRKSALFTRNCNENTDVEISPNVTCAVCKKKVTSKQWIDHIQQEHTYQAWREGDTPLNVEDNESIRKHLYMILQEQGALVCSKCSKPRKYVKLFLQHVENCTGPKELDHTLDTSYAEFESVIDASLNVTGTESTKLVKCGRCHLELESKQWINHIQEEHNYLSWQEGYPPLDIDDGELVRRYLYVVVQKLGSLKCSKCGVVRKYVKNYLSHIENCTGLSDSEAKDTNKASVRLSTEEDNFVNIESSSQPRSTTLVPPTVPAQVEPVVTIKCGVCQKEMKDSNWMSHISMNHEYVAWKETDTPVDLNNYEAIWQHLTNIIRGIGALKCAECGRKCKYAKAYLLHIQACYGKTYVAIDDGNSTMDGSVSDVDTTCVEEDSDTEAVKCGVCSAEVEASQWIEHIQQQHNYLAWQEGDAAIDLENKQLIRSHLKSILRKVGRLTCAKCGLRRRKALQFYKHMKTCNGTTKLLDRPLRILKPKIEISETFVKCAVCDVEVSDSSWITHISTQHDYMAWRYGDKPLNVDDKTAVKEHLYQISQNEGELICNKCGQSRKYVKSYLQHTRGCAGSEESPDGSFKVPQLKTESTEIVTCAVCRLEMNDYMWMEHIAKEHNYVAWKQNDPPLVLKDEKSLRDYLYNIVQSIGTLVCNKCGLVRKYAKSYIQHIESCQKVTWMSINKMITKIKREKGDMVRCAVCEAEVDDTEWLEHSASQHHYLAWRDRDPPLNVDDEDEVRKHLKNIIQEEGYLKCPKCKLHRKYVKLYLQHVNNCDGTSDENAEMAEAELASDMDVDGPVGSTVKCGVCAQEVGKAAWIAHIRKEHKYLAWQEGKEPIDVTDKEAVYNHLTAINIKCRGLTCDSCGVVRKYVKAYMQHVEDCSERNYVDSNEIIECGVCGEKMVGKFWRDHAMQMHYNIAWVVGDTPINLRNFFSVDKYLKEYHEFKHKLVCNICGLSRASLAGFYAHILICGKTDEEIDAWKDSCTICNQKYLCIYRTQHYWAHRVQEMGKERQYQVELKKEEPIQDDVTCTPGRRRAAEKARSVIGDYAAKIASNKCKSCSFESDSKEELAGHRCGTYAGKSTEDSDESVSIKLEDFSDEDSVDTDIDSDLSNEDEDYNESSGIKIKCKNGTTETKSTKKFSKFPFEVRDSRPYLQESKSDHFKLYYTRETLFPHWRDSALEVVPDELMSQYMPQMEESCKLSVSNDGWTAYKRFESSKENGCKVFFTGGSIQCIAWVPEHPDSTPRCHSLLAVSTHRGPDCPRLHCTDTDSYPGLIQMWDFQTFKSLPNLAFGLAHDYGTVWGMDWCPSGARDLSDGGQFDDNVRPRLGLLALACSNGLAYVISVPYPDNSQTIDVTFYKIKPCVELRVTRGSIKYQATSVNWSLFKGYTTIMVGYGDGTVAMYDLVTESPLLTAKAGDVDILYPFQDERVHNSCVTGVTSSVLGAWCSSSVTGSTAGVAEAEPRAGRGAHPVRAHSGLAAGTATFMPHWPNVMMSGDDTIVGLSPSELEWGYVGRRVGSVRALAPCVHRARVFAVVPPLLQTLRPHPAAFKGHKTIHKKNVAMLEMTPLAKKRSKHSNDELSMKVEPVTYEDAIASYGIEFKFERDFDKAFVHRMQLKHRVPFPERFPLADVPALAYCPAAAHYTKLALATHSGLVLLLDV